MRGSGPPGLLEPMLPPARLGPVGGNVHIDSPLVQPRGQLSGVEADKTTDLEIRNSALAHQASNVAYRRRHGVGDRLYVEKLRQ